MKRVISPLKASMMLAGFLSLDAMAHEAVTQLEPVFVTATRSMEHHAQNNSLDLVSREELSRRQASNILALVEDETGVSGIHDPVRRGNAGISIRGIRGNRVLYLIDGVRQPDRYEGGGGNGAISGGDFTEPEVLSRVEIVKGPSSSLYGSDAIGGIFAYQTLSPERLVSDKTGYFASAKTGLRTEDRSVFGSATLAAKGEVFSGLLQYVSRKGREVKNKGENGAGDLKNAANRTQSNPQHWDSENWLIKFGAKFNEHHHAQLTYESFEREIDTDVVNARGMSMAGNLTVQLAEDSQRRERITFHHQWKNPEAKWIQGASWRVYQQKLGQDEFVREYRTGASTLRTSNYNFSQTLTGFDGQLESNYAALGGNNQLIVGLESSVTESSRLRDRTQFNTNGTQTKVVGGEPFPHKTFPDNKTQRLGIFAENRSRWDSGLSVTAGVRYDRYQLKLAHDALSQKIAVANSAHTLSSHAVSPKIAVSYDFSPNLTAFGQFSTGFRAPPFDDASMAFSNITHGYEVLPNSGLNPEKSRGIELGLRGQDDEYRWRVTAFSNHYDDFIERAYVGRRMVGARMLQVYQFQNVGKVRIHGLELSGVYRLTPHWSVSGALSWADGKQHGQTYSGVDPLNGFVRAAYSTEHFGADATLRFAAAKKDVPAALNRMGRAEEAFKPSADGVLDMTAYLQLNKQARLQLGVYNVLDKKYWNWADVRGFAASASNLDLYSRPARNVSASFEYRF